MVETADLPGFRRGRLLEKIGQHGLDTAELFFDDVRVPADEPARRRGRPGLSAADAAAAARAAADRRRRRGDDAARGRRDAGLRRAAPGVRRAAAGDAEHALQARRMRRPRRRSRRPSSTPASSASSHGTLDVPTAAMAKWSTTDKLCRVVDECLQLHGGYGYMTEYPIARHVCRRARAAHPRRRQRGDEGADRACDGGRRMKTHWPPGVPPSVPKPKGSLWHALDGVGRGAPATRPRSCYGADELSYARARAPGRGAGRLAAAPRRRVRGDRVLLWSQNCPQFCCRDLRRAACRCGGRAGQRDVDGRRGTRTWSTTAAPAWRSLPPSSRRGSADAALANDAAARRAW